METPLDVLKMRVGGRVMGWPPLLTNKAVGEVVTVAMGLEG